MKLIVGLGNPGRSYSEHRHNIGFRVLDLLGERHGVEMKRRSFGSLVGSGVIEGEAVLLAKPQTYMNISGDAVRPLLGYYKLTTRDLIVVHDDIDIDVGRLKLAFEAGHGGHNGVRSIIDALSSSEFCRVRIGVGRPDEGIDAADYVLRPFDKDELETVEGAIVRAADAVEKLISEGLASAQQKFH